MGHHAFYGGAVRSHSGARRRGEGQEAAMPSARLRCPSPAHAMRTVLPPRRPQDHPGVRGEVVPHSGNHPGSGPELTHSAFRPAAAGEYAKRQMARSGKRPAEVIA